MTAKFAHDIFELYKNLRTIKEMRESELLSFLIYMRADDINQINAFLGVNKNMWSNMLQGGIDYIEDASIKLLKDINTILDNDEYTSIKFNNLENIQYIVEFCNQYPRVIGYRTEGSVTEVGEGRECVDRYITELSSAKYSTHGTSISRFGTVMIINTNQDVTFKLIGKPELNV